MPQLEYIVGDAVSPKALPEQVQRLFNEFYSAKPNAEIVSLAPQVIVLPEGLMPTFVVGYHNHEQAPTPA